MIYQFMTPPLLKVVISFMDSPLSYRNVRTSSDETCGTIEGLTNNIAGVSTGAPAFAGFVIKGVPRLV